jgi:arylsulfatase A-like enzyme
VDIKPVDIEVTPNLQSSVKSGPKPNVFIVVIDSLRRDYVSAYNPKVAFTPAIDRFAKENIVMNNAFTHYGGTGLAEPSIWVGGMMVHKQYVTPFYPMNTLAKLTSAEGYRSLVSVDTILTTIVPKTPAVADIDAGVLNMDYDMCRSLNQMTSSVSAARQESNAPIFGYTQPQNIHISVIAREGKTVPPGETYPGFYAPYASRLRRIDACFGQFIDSLKQMNLYDSSIVILTSDHGDSLGEEGRFGHAYTIYPEVVRIPLLVHLPPEMRGAMFYDNSAPVFSTDITPSLYYLLGHENVTNTPTMGRPLFTRRREDQVPYLRNDYLIASSYAAVYGLLSGNGRRLYISDAVNERDYVYELSTGATEAIDSGEQLRSRERIRVLVDQVDGVYGFRPR